MYSKDNNNKDHIYRCSEQHHLMTTGFLSALKESCSPEKAFRIAKKGFANYMTHHYNMILASERPNTQKRFDKFRKHYEEGARRSSYLDIVESSPKVLEARFIRCPFSEVMKEYGLFEFAPAFCLSDYAFTENCLPGVKFERAHEIVKGDDHCDHTWVYGDI